MITGSDLASIWGQRFQTPDSGAAGNPATFDPTFASYLGEPPAPVPFEISKADFASVFTALGGSQGGADAKFAQLDKGGDGTLDQGDLLSGAPYAPALSATQPPDPSGPAPYMVPIEDPATALLWTGNIAPTAPSSDAHPQPAAPTFGDLPPSPGSSSPTGGLAWMSPEGMRVLLDAQAAKTTPASYVGNPPPPVDFEITKSNYETVFMQLGGSLEEADLLFAKLDQDGDGSLDQGDLLIGAKNTAPALTATNGPAAPVGLAASGTLVSQLLPNNPFPLPVK
jgi:hypothetical protein